MRAKSWWVFIWRWAAGIHQLIKQKKSAAAGDLAALNNRLQIADLSRARQTLSFILMRKVEEAKGGP